MYRQEYKDWYNKSKEFKKIFGFSYWHYFNLAKLKWKNKINQMKLERPNVKIVLHHINVNDPNYELWDCIPMYTDEHTKLHQDLISNDTRIKFIEGGKATRFNKNNIPIQKGKTYEEIYGEEKAKEIKRKMSLKKKGKCHSEETKKKMSGKKPWNKDLKWNEETKRKISENRKGKCKGIKFSEERKNNISKALKGKHLSEETKKKMSQSRKGKKQSKETIKKRIESIKRKKQNEQNN